MGFGGAGGAGTLGAMSPAPPRRSGAADWSDRRADARRNHERVMTAAAEVLAERGTRATVPEIAARAGVGKATIYRSYPTKTELLRAVALRQLDWVAERVATAAAEPDGLTALHGLLGDVCERLARDRFLVEVLPRAQRWLAEKDLSGQLARIIATAQDQGTLRPDATVQDLQVLVSGCSRVLLDLGVRDPAQWRRYVALILAALRPDASDGPRTPLPG